MKKLFSTFVLLFAFSLEANTAKGFPKEYYKLHGKASKQYFFDFMIPKIQNANMKILEQRKFILALNGNTNLNTNSNAYKRLSELQKKYKVKKLYDYNAYLQRIDIIPPSMAIAQAATESGWGKSRFVKDANNIFGHWTYNPKIGLVPRERPKGHKHFIRIFPNLQASIEAYMLNLNRTKAYTQFRIQREELRKKGTFIDGLKLSQTMINYSGIGQKYLDILSSIIRTNKLQKYDKKFYNLIKDKK